MHILYLVSRLFSLMMCNIHVISHTKVPNYYHLCSNESNALEEPPAWAGSRNLSTRLRMTSKHLGGDLSKLSK